MKSASKGKTIASLQSSYLPWLGFFEQMYRSDIFVIADDFPYDKHGWRNRNRIKTPDGVRWLTVPVLTSGKGNLRIHEVLIDNTNAWRRKHLKSIKQNYSKAPYFDKYLHLFENAYSRKWKYLLDLNMHFIEVICKILNLERKIIYSSTLKASGNKVERPVNICKELGADTFYEGEAGKDYIDIKLFERAGITLEFQEYRHPVYKQLYGDFVPHLSVIDLIFNHGDESLEILTLQNTNIVVSR